jgi:hypothetical protein
MCDKRAQEASKNESSLPWISLFHFQNRAIVLENEIERSNAIAAGAWSSCFSSDIVIGDLAVGNRRLHLSEFQEEVHHRKKTQNGRKV